MLTAHQGISHVARDGIYQPGTRVALSGGARTVARGWSDEEDRLFQEALEQHGRDWAACAAHIGTRDTKSVTSHAQKWLIRLAIDGKPLPVKVSRLRAAAPWHPTCQACSRYLRVLLLHACGTCNSPACVGCSVACGPDGGERSGVHAVRKTPGSILRFRCGIWPEARYPCTCVPTSTITLLMDSRQRRRSELPLLQDTHITLLF